jgi:hypothetical protein
MVWLIVDIVLLVMWQRSFPLEMRRKSHKQLSETVKVDLSVLAKWMWNNKARYRDRWLRVVEGGHDVVRRNLRLQIS